MSKPKILVTMPVPDEVASSLKSFADVEIRSLEIPIDKEELVRSISDKDALICMLSESIDKDVIDAGKNLKAIAVYAVGYNNVDIEYAKNKKISVLNTPGVLTETTADLTWSLIMSVARRVVEGDRYTREGKFKGWAPTLMMGGDIHGETLGVFGMGRIGQAVARRALGFNMNVIYHKRNRLEESIEESLNAKYVDLETLTSESDFLVLLAPLTPETKYIFNKERLKLMKKTAYMINVGRGPLIDEAALVEMLKNKEIAGAGFDVYEHEPELTSGLVDLDNVVLLPHVGSASLETRTKMGLMLSEGIRKILDGKAPANLVT